MKGKAPTENRVSKEEKIDFLINLYQLHKSEEIEDECGGLILRYIEIDSSEVAQLNDANMLKGAVSFMHGVMGVETGVIILRDLVPEKFRRYVAMHETTEIVTRNHWHAVQDEFKAAEAELSAEDFKAYCKFRLSLHQNDVATVKEIRRWVSDEAKRVLSGVQKELGITLRKSRTPESK